MIASPAPHQPIPLRSISRAILKIALTHYGKIATHFCREVCDAPPLVSLAEPPTALRFAYLSEHRFVRFEHLPNRSQERESPSLTYPLHGSTGRSYAPPLRSVLPANQAGGLGGLLPPQPNITKRRKFRLKNRRNTRKFASI